jgi:hypothetical protein
MYFLYGDKAILHPYKTADTLIFIFLDRRWENKTF